MSRHIWRTVVLAGLLTVAAHSLAIAQKSPEPTLDERFQNAVDPAPEAELPLLNPQTVNQPAADLPTPNPPSVVAAPRTANGPAYLGVTFNPQFRNAAVVRTVNPGSPAEQAGLQPGDAIESLQGREVNSYQDVLDTIGTMKVGEVLQIEFSRRITARTHAALDTLPSASPRSVGYPPDLPASESVAPLVTGPRLLPAPVPPPTRPRATVPPQNRNMTPQNKNQNQNRNSPDDRNNRTRGLLPRRR